MAVAVVAVAVAENFRGQRHEQVSQLESSSSALNQGAQLSEQPTGTAQTGLHQTCQTWPEMASWHAGDAVHRWRAQFGVRIADGAKERS